MNTEIGQLQEMPQQGGEQPQKKGAFFYILAVAGGVAAFAVIAAYIGYWYVLAQIRKPLMLSEKHVFVIEKGESVQTIANDLEKKGLIRSGFFFRAYVWENNLSRSLQAGTYAADSPVSIQTIADMIVRGAVVRDTISVTIPEGFSMRDIEAKLKEVGLLKNEKRHLADLTVDDFKQQYDFLRSAPARASMEGYLFPDTYEFKKDVTLPTVADMMLANFAKKTNSTMSAEIERQGKTMYEIIIMASVIEREVMTPDDMKLVSGVLWKRIALGMPLQVDASTIYALGRNDITRDDLAVDSPYNTYRYKGLPKGPIANPGMNAVTAAVYPAASDYLYYISTPDKQTVFSRTIQEHNAAVMKYLK